MLPDVYNNNYQIVQTPDAVMILVEMVHDARIVRINGKHLPGNITPWLGDSIGHWEGDTLVVETTNLHPGQKAHYGIKQRFYLPPTGKVTERFTRISDKEILYQFTVEDSEAYTQPWHGEVPRLATNDRSSSTPATRATTRCREFSPARANRKSPGRRRRQWQGIFFASWAEKQKQQATC